MKSVDLLQCDSLSRHPSLPPVHPAISKTTVQALNGYEFAEANSRQKKPPYKGRLKDGVWRGMESGLQAVIKERHRTGESGNGRRKVYDEPQKHPAGKDQETVPLNPAQTNVADSHQST